MRMYMCVCVYVDYGEVNRSSAFTFNDLLATRIWCVCVCERGGRFVVCVLSKKELNLKL